jgi:hypothetical protein
VIERQRSTATRSVLGWLLRGSLAAVLVVAWTAMFSGGMRAVIAFTLLASVVPLLGLLNLVLETVRLVRTRRWASPILVGLALSSIALWPAAWNFGWAMIRFPTRLEHTAPSVTVRLPSNEALRVAWGGDTLEVNQHASFPDQRWAYDLFVAPYLVNSRELEAYGCWDTPVVAPIDARVHLARDGRPDATPGDLSSSDPTGNSVVLALPTGTFLLIAHLKRGSVRVRAGDFVKEGDMIGACGNSGMSSEPHIHIHHQRQDPATHPVGFAEGLPLFFRDHGGDRMPHGGISEQNGRPVATGAVVQHRKR